MAIVANDPPRVLNAQQIAQILPHRYPFALVDRITDYQPGQWARGVNASASTSRFSRGIFPAGRSCRASSSWRRWPSAVQWRR